MISVAHSCLFLQRFENIKSFLTLRLGHLDLVHRPQWTAHVFLEWRLSSCGLSPPSNHIHTRARTPVFNSQSRGNLSSWFLRYPSRTVRTRRRYYTFKRLYTNRNSNRMMVELLAFYNEKHIFPFHSFQHRRSTSLFLMPTSLFDCFSNGNAMLFGVIPRRCFSAQVTLPLQHFQSGHPGHLADPEVGLCSLDGGH